MYTQKYIDDNLKLYETISGETFYFDYQKECVLLNDIINFSNETIKDKDIQLIKSICKIPNVVIICSPKVVMYVCGVHKIMQTSDCFIYNDIFKDKNKTYFVYYIKENFIRFFWLYKDDLSDDMIKKLRRSYRSEKLKMILIKETQFISN